VRPHRYDALLQRRASCLADRAHRALAGELMTSALTGKLNIGGEFHCGGGRKLRALDPAGQVALEPVYACADAADAELACEQARSAATALAAEGAPRRAELLTSVARELDRAGAAIAGRLSAEAGVSTTHALTQVQALATRYRISACCVGKSVRNEAMRALGTVVVFGSDQFELVLSIAGNCTMQALAAGCPVIALASKVFPGTSELLARAIQRALKAASFPKASFSLLLAGEGTVHAVLFSAPSVAALCFDAAMPEVEAIAHRALAIRPTMLIVRESLSSHVFIALPQMLNSCAEAIAREFIVQALEAGGRIAGRAALLCALDGNGYVDLREAMAALVPSNPCTFVTAALHRRYLSCLTALMSQDGVQCVCEGEPAVGLWGVQAMLLEVDAAAILARPALVADVVGPLAILVRCARAEDLLCMAVAPRAAELLTVFAEAADGALFERLAALTSPDPTRILRGAFDMPRPATGTAQDLVEELSAARNWRRFTTRLEERDAARCAPTGGPSGSSDRMR
jgi:alpha-ketoglutaric semialdehyde dehydrogenase